MSSSTTSHNLEAVRAEIRVLHARIDAIAAPRRAGQSFGRRLRAAREARGWSQTEAVRELRRTTTIPLTASEEAMVRNWKRWEAGATPGPLYRPALETLFASDTPPSTLFDQPATTKR